MVTDPKGAPRIKVLTLADKLWWCFVAVTFVVVSAALVGTLFLPTAQQKTEESTLRAAQTGGYSFPRPTSAHCIPAGGATWYCGLYRGKVLVATAQSSSLGSVFAPKGYEFPVGGK